MWLLIWFTIWCIYMGAGLWICAAARRVERTQPHPDSQYELMEKESPLL